MGVDDWPNWLRWVVVLMSAGGLTPWESLGLGSTSSEADGTPSGPEGCPGVWDQMEINDHGAQHIGTGGGNWDTLHHGPVPVNFTDTWVEGLPCPSASMPWVDYGPNDPGVSYASDSCANGLDGDGWRGADWMDPSCLAVTQNQCVNPGDTCDGYNLTITYGGPFNGGVFCDAVVWYKSATEGTMWGYGNNGHAAPGHGPWGITWGGVNQWPSYGATQGQPGLQGFLANNQTALNAPASEGGPAAAPDFVIQSPLLTHPCVGYLDADGTLWGWPGR